MRITIVVGAALGLMLAGFVMLRYQRATAAHEQEPLLVAQAAAAPEVQANAPRQEAGQNRFPAPSVEDAPRPPYAYRAEWGSNALKAAETLPYPGYPAGPSGDPETMELMRQDQQLEQEVQSLVRQLADNDDDKQGSELKEKLSAALEKQFDMQQKLRELEVSRIEARVQKLRDLVRKRTDSRRKIIDNRREQLLNDAEGLGWNSATAAGVRYVPPPMLGLPGSTRTEMIPVTVPPRQQQ